MVHRIYPETLHRAVACLKQGGIIAYPTEGVYGLGCDPFNKVAIHRLLAIKQRPVDKGLIMIAANWEQLQSWVVTLDPARMAEIFATWPGPTTWVLPANPALPSWIRGEHESVAVRVTAHPEAAALCKAFGKPLISTSANRQGETPTRDNLEVYSEFGDAIDYIVPGRVGELTEPTPIYDGLTGSVLRG